jgi:lantibiotic leader peptide-processing serine protease
MRRTVPLLCAVALAACADSPVEVTRAPAPRLIATKDVSATARHVVLLSKGGGRDDFTRTVKSLGGSVVARHEGAGFAVVEGLTANGAASLARASGVQAVEPDLVAQVIEPPRAQSIEAADLATASVANPAGARLFPRQWNMQAIGAPTAWTAGRRGSGSVTVAILDSGIDDTYTDFSGVFPHTDAIPVNGLVDRARSASFLPTSSIPPGVIPANFDCSNPTDHELINGRAAFGPCPALPPFHAGRPAWADLNGHGTFTAGIVSSKAEVFAGVTSNVKLMAVKVLGASGSGSFSAILQGVAHATDNGADVINMSLGAVILKHGGYIGFLNGVTRYAHSRGVTIVVAAGNEGIDLDHSGGVYTAFCSSGMVICVSATGPVIAVNAAGNPSVNGPRFLPTPDEPAIYSNYGTSSVDVAAPGGNYAVQGNVVTSVVWIWGGCSRTSLIRKDPPEESEEGTPPEFPYYDKACHTGVFIVQAYGTSAAAPHVSGLAALLVENLGRNPGQIRTRIQQTADDLGKPGADAHYGKGRINVPRALGL